MTEIEIRNTLGTLLTGLLWELLNQRAIFNPCQVAISTYYPKENKGKYVLFNTDIFPILSYLHPLANDHDLQQAFKTQLAGERQELINQLGQFSAEGKPGKKKKTESIGDVLTRSYKVLRDVSFEKPLMGKLFRECLKAKKSQDFHSLSYELLREARRNPGEWDAGCVIEKALFLAQFYTYYDCTFFNFRGLPDDRVFCISIFCTLETLDRIDNCVLDYLSNDESVELLEDIAYKYLPAAVVSGIVGLPPAPVKENAVLAELTKEFSDLRETEHTMHLSGTGMHYSPKLVAALDKLIASLKEKTSNNLPLQDGIAAELRTFILKIRNADAGTKEALQTLSNIIDTLNRPA